MIPYDTGFPTGQDSLGSTQAKFINNWINLKTFLDVNHMDFGTTQAGRHSKVVMANLPANSIGYPDTTIGTNTNALYNDNDPSGNPQIFIQPTLDNDGSKRKQLTAGDITDPDFAAITGWTFLPGKLFLQWGMVSPYNPAFPKILFPVEFSAACYSVSFTSLITVANTGNPVIYVANRAVLNDKTGIGVTQQGPSASSNGFYWMAIGPAGPI